MLDAMLGFLALVAAVPQADAAPPAPEPPVRTVVAAEARFAGIRQGLIDKVRSGRIPSIAIAVTERGRTIWEEAIGWADRERGIAATTGISYAVGSLSKSLAAATLLALVERGMVELDAPVDRWIRLPAPTGVRLQPTLRHLLDASGGVPHGWRVVDPTRIPATQAAWDDWLAANAFLAFTPGTVFEYSNNSFGVAARVAERVTGLPFPDVAHRYLFAPLGMDASHAILSPGLAPMVAAGYDGPGAPLAPAASIPDGGLGMLASAADLARFGNLLRGRAPPGREAPLSPATVATFWQPAVGPSREFFHFGFWNGGRSLVTNGNIGGANAHLAIGREADVVVAVTVNQTGYDADETADAILGVLVPPVAGAPDIRAAYGALHALPYRATPQFKGTWAGTIFAGGAAVPLILEAGTDSVRVRFGSGPPHALRGAERSAFGELRGTVTAQVPGLPGADTVPTRLDLILAAEGAVLRGYVLPRASVAQPAAVRLERPR